MQTKRFSCVLLALTFLLVAAMPMATAAGQDPETIQPFAVAFFEGGVKYNYNIIADPDSYLNDVLGERTPITMYVGDDSEGNTYLLMTFEDKYACQNYLASGESQNEVEEEFYKYADGEYTALQVETAVAAYAGNNGRAGVKQLKPLQVEDEKGFCIAVRAERK
jgi:hypothetical protein